MKGLDSRSDWLKPQCDVEEKKNGDQKKSWKEEGREGVNHSKAVSHTCFFRAPCSHSS